MHNIVLPHLKKLWVLNSQVWKIWRDYSRREPQFLVVKAIEIWRFQEKRKWGVPMPGDIDPIVRRLKRDEKRAKEEQRRLKEAKALENKPLTAEEREARAKAMKAIQNIGRSVPDDPSGQE